MLCFDNLSQLDNGFRFEEVAGNRQRNSNRGIRKVRQVDCPVRQHRVDAGLRLPIRFKPFSEMTIIEKCVYGLGFLAGIGSLVGADKLTDNSMSTGYAVSQPVYSKSSRVQQVEPAGMMTGVSTPSDEIIIELGLSKDTLIK